MAWYGREAFDVLLEIHSIGRSFHTHLLSRSLDSY